MRFTKQIFRRLSRVWQHLFIAGAFCLFLAPGLAAQSAAVSGRISSLGFGGDVGLTIGENFGVRAGLNGFSFSFDGEEDDIDYEFDVDLLTAALLVEYYFSPIGFRLSAGGMINGNEAGMLAEPADDEVEIGDETYTREEVGDLTGGVEFDNVNPYVGLGLDTSFGKRGSVGFVAEIGAMFHGSPAVSLEANGPIATDAEFQAELERERKDVEDDLSDFKVYPVVALGISYRF
jgi:hypothetical protein